MRVLKSAVAFMLVFCMLAVTVVGSALAGEQTAVEGVGTSETLFAGEPVDIEDIPMPLDDDCEYSPRLTAPAKSNPYYYSNKNVFYKFGYGMPNCTAYAYGRAYEILGKEPQLCIYDAYQWFDYNKDNGIYQYGTTPKLGAIVCFKYRDYNQGHVAVVEKIVGDTVYYSNSAWGGGEFYITTSPVDDPTDGYSGWIFQGFIYIGDYYSGDEDADIYKITSNTGVNLRSGAGTSYDLVGAIPYGKTVAVLETKEQDGYIWGYTSYNGVCGWFVTDFAQLISGGDKPTEPSTSPTTPTGVPQGIIGDADLDGDISVLDATQIQLFIAGLASPSETQISLSDYDGDGEMSVLDATKILLKLAGLE
ncbi:MAG: CHAP domain-containing protein [Ruminococcus sp.]|nr:CHAP domain-containing protein [Ruminococcus sp.]